MLYRPLFWTAYWCEDWLNVSAYRGASCILISSASAKTAFCLAYLIGKRATKPDTSRLRVIGLTSKKNLDFTRSLCLYDDIFDYDSLERSLAPQVVEHKWLYIDVAGNDQLNDHVRTVLAEGSSLVGSVQLGLTTLSPSAPSASSTSFTTKITSDTPCQVIDGRESTMDQFFMPEWLAVRRRQMSVSQITALQAQAWHDLMRDGKEWVNIVRVCGGAAVEEAYRDIARRGTDPRVGMVWSLWDDITDLDREAKPKL